MLRGGWCTFQTCPSFFVLPLWATKEISVHWEEEFASLLESYIDRNKEHAYLPDWKGMKESEFTTKKWDYDLLPLFFSFCLWLLIDCILPSASYSFCGARRSCHENSRAHQFLYLYCTRNVMSVLDKFKVRIEFIMKRSVCCKEWWQESAEWPFVRSAVRCVPYDRVASRYNHSLEILHHQTKRSFIHRTIAIHVVDSRKYSVQCCSAVFFHPALSLTPERRYRYRPETQRPSPISTAHGKTKKSSGYQVIYDARNNLSSISPI